MDKSTVAASDIPISICFAVDLFIMLCDITIKGEKIVAAKPAPDAATKPEACVLDGLVGYRLRRASARMMSDFASSMSPLALRPVLFAMLCVIRGNPGIIQMGLGA